MNSLKTFFGLVASPAGRWARVVVGALVLTTGVRYGLKARPWAALGLLPLATGALDLCPMAPLAGLPVQGKALRQQLGAGTSSRRGRQ
jgi:hypothetical protein